MKNMNEDTITINDYGLFLDFFPTIFLIAEFLTIKYLCKRENEKIF